MKDRSGTPPRFIEDLAEGDTASFTAVVDQRLHEGFTELSGDSSPIHTDAAFASRTGFGRPIGYAYLLTALLSRLYGTILPGGSSVCISQQLQFPRPYYAGDRLTVEGRVTRASRATQLVDIECTITRDNGDVVLRGTGTVRVAFGRRHFEPLFETKEGALYAADLASALAACGVARGDTIFVHSDISAFGKLATLDRSFLLSSIVEVLEGAVGRDGRLLMPAFSYSFCKDEPFSPRETPSTVGVLTEFFRKRDAVVRSEHPIFSVAVLARDASEFAEVGLDSFGEESIFARLHRAGGKIAFLGAPFDSMTFIHYVEQARGVDYRYLKPFSGTLRGEGEPREVTASFYVRDLSRNVELDLARLEQALLASGDMRRANVGGGRIEVVSADAVFRTANALLDVDPYALLRQPP